MTANELRIGNLVYSNSHETEKVFKISAIDDRGYVEFSGGGICEIDQLEPIPIADEWAVKFGYENMTEMWMDFIDNCFFRIDIGYYDFIKLNVPQAQNLYYCLIGEELTLNE